MRMFAAASLLLSLVACDEMDMDMKESYATWADAERAGAIERGWVPAFVPTSAHDIRDTHDLDTNAQTLEFTTRPADVQTMVAGLSSITTEDKNAAAKLSRELGYEDVRVRAVEAYIVCSNFWNGALLVDRETGRTVFRMPVAWVDDDCPLNNVDLSG